MTERPSNGDPFLPGPVFAAPYHLAGDPAESEFTYGRYDNPTWRAYEQAVGSLEGGDAVVVASGMAAVTTLLLALLQPGDRIVIPSDAYYNVRQLAHELLPYEVQEVPTDTAAVVEAAPGAALVWIETPSNPGLDVVDIRAVAEATEGTLVVDNTLATPLGQRPLELGADYVIGERHEGAQRAQRPPARLRGCRRRRGGADCPRQARHDRRAVRSLARASLARDPRRSARARMRERAAACRAGRRARAGALSGAPRATPPTRSRRKQMDRFGPVLCFTLPDASAADAFFAASELVIEATSFGGVHTTAERRARWGSDDVPEGYIRLSAGCEDPDALAQDVGQALARALERP